MNAHKTAITRTGPSAPMKWLDARGLIVGRVLDFGSGKGYDAGYYDTESYDPYYDPVMPKGKFDTIVCNFVLNVVESKKEREAIIRRIKSKLACNGCAYITVRNDKKALNGRTTIGTWQGLIVLDLPVVHSCSGFVTYLVSLED